MGTGASPGGYSGRGLAFTTNPFLAPRLERSRAISEHPSVRHDTLRREHYQLHLRLPSCYFTSGFPTKLLYAFLISCVHPPSHPSLLKQTTHIRWEYTEL